MIAFDGAKASCAVIVNGRDPSPYRCEARKAHDTEGGVNEAKVAFVIDDKK